MKYYLRAVFIFLAMEATAYAVAFQVIPFVWLHQSSAAFHACVALSVLATTLFAFGVFLPFYSLPEKGTKK